MRNENSKFQQVLNIAVEVNLQKQPSKFSFYEKVLWKYAANLQENTHA